MRNLLDTERVAWRRASPQTPWPERMERAAEGVFAALLSRPISTDASPAGRSGDLTAVVALTGAISGSLSLCCSSAAAGNFASLLLGVPHPTEEQIRITLGELAYRIARALAREASGPAQQCRLTSPVTTGHANADSNPPGESYLTAFDFQGFPVWIRFTLYISDF